MSRRWWAIAKVVVGLAVLGVLAARVGTEPFVAGLRAVGPGSVAAALCSPHSPPRPVPSGGAWWPGRTASG